MLSQNVRAPRSNNPGGDRRRFLVPSTKWPLPPSKSAFFTPSEFESENNLLAFLGSNPNEIKKIWWFQNRMYSLARIPKRGGGTRDLHVPNDRLKFLQRKINEILNQIYKIRYPVHGFAKGKSVKSNAESHLGRKHILNLDLKEFFTTITETRISGLLDSVGVDPTVAKIVARICCLRGVLPQGAPTSPTFSNMICYRLDRDFIKFCKERHIKYTRYADDLSFSTYSEPGHFFVAGAAISGKIQQEQINAEIVSIITRNGFTINKDKIRYLGPLSRRVVTGCVINEKVNVPRRFVRETRAIIYCIEKFGVAAAEAKLHSITGGKASIQKVARGKIEWIGFVKGRNDPTYRRYANRYNACFSGSSIKILPSATEVRDRSIWIVEYCYDDSKGNVCSEQGTAFFLDGVGLVTAYHCVENGKDIKVYHPDNVSNKYDVHIDKFCATRDLALLSHSIPDEDFYLLHASDQLPNKGDAVTAVGYPTYGPGDHISERKGLVNSLPVKSAVRLIETSIIISNGLSGAPIMDDDGKVVGIGHKGGANEDKNLAVAIDVLEGWIEELKK
jgi:RNA-directed DNA polymerase